MLLLLMRVTCCSGLSLVAATPPPLLAAAPQALPCWLPAPVCVCLAMLVRSVCR